MNKIFSKILAFLFGLMSLGSISESYRIMTSSASDIAPQRTYLTIISLGMLALFLFLTRYFWRKGKK
jgi:Na+-driven multidrug efflux pump